MKTIEDLKYMLENDQQIYRYTVDTSSHQVTRDVCYGKLDMIKKVLDFLEENNI